MKYLSLYSNKYELEITWYRTPHVSSYYIGTDCIGSYKSN
jgi:hypothetical protein